MDTFGICSNKSFIMSEPIYIIIVLRITTNKNTDITQKSTMTNASSLSTIRDTSIFWKPQKTIHMHIIMDMVICTNIIQHKNKYIVLK